MAEQEPSKLMTRVRFPLPAPTSKTIDSDYAVSGSAAGRNGGNSCDQRETVRRSAKAHTLSVVFLVGVRTDKGALVLAYEPGSSSGCGPHNSNSVAEQ